VTVTFFENIGLSMNKIEKLQPAALLTCMAAVHKGGASLFLRSDI